MFSPPPSSTQSKLKDRPSRPLLMSNTFIVTARWPQRRRCEARCGSSAGASPEPRQSFAGVHVREPRRGFAGASPEPRWSAFPGASPEPRQSLAGVHVREPHWGLAGASPELRWSACPGASPGLRRSFARASLECMWWRGDVARCRLGPLMREDAPVGS